MAQITTRCDPCRAAHCARASRCRHGGRAAAGSRHAASRRPTSVTAFPMADGAAPFGVTAGPRGEYVSLNTSVGRFDHHDNLTTYPIPSADPSRAG